jgi:hypothetical protein
MKRIVACFSSCAIAATLAGCHPKDQGSEFASGVPRQSTVAMQVPGSDSKALTVEGSSHALLGQLAEWYITTRTMTATVNAGAVAVGTLVRIITDNPPTNVSTDEAIWGPWQGPLDPLEWKVTITRVALHQYQYKFEGRDKHDPTAAFVTILSGSHAPGLDSTGEEMEGFGSGTFTLDWDARATLPQADRNVGTANYTYDHKGPATVASISAKFRKVRDDSNQQGKLIDVDYAFVQNPLADGNMQFELNVPANATSAGGLGKVNSRWQWSGAGRSDVMVTATDTSVVYTVSECWDTSYLSVYKTVPLSSSASDNYGSESSCVFTTPSYSNL